MNYRFKTKCCPDANGREPIVGESMFFLTFTTDEGAELTIEMGRQGWENFREMIGAQEGEEVFRLREEVARLRCKP